MFVVLEARDPLNGGGKQEVCAATVQISLGPEDDHSEPPVRQAALERLNALVTEALREFRDPRAIDR
jgi:hypothetical protein